MRALAAYEPADWPPPEAARTRDELERLGYRRNRDSPTIERYVDPIEEPRHRPPGEGAKGLCIRRHPLAWLRDTPEVWDVTDELQDGVLEELVAEDRHRRSAAEWDLITTYLGALQRRRARELRPTSKGASASGGGVDGHS